jgi:hypothetical protein
MAKARSLLQGVWSFLAGFVARDRYLTEALAAVVTFGTGVAASLTLDDVQTRISLQGIREMQYPEVLVMAFAAPGMWCSARLIYEGERDEGWTSFGVMSSFWGLGLFSIATNLSNWGFWTIFCLLLGTMKGYALVREWTYLRWSVTVLGCFWWTIFTINLGENLPRGLWVLLVPCVGFAAANLLSVSRLAGDRYRG